MLTGQSPEVHSLSATSPSRPLALAQIAWDICIHVDICIHKKILTFSYCLQSSPQHMEISVYSYACREKYWNSFHLQELSSKSPSTWSSRSPDTFTNCSIIQVRYIYIYIYIYIYTCIFTWWLRLGLGLRLSLFNVKLMHLGAVTYTIPSNNDIYIYIHNDTYKQTHRHTPTHIFTYSCIYILTYT